MTRVSISPTRCSVPSPDSGPAPRSLESWVAALVSELRIPELADLDVSLVLDLARDAAHGVARPAAPVTTFLVGYAAGRQGADADAVRLLAASASRLAGQAPEPAPGAGA